MAIAILAIDSQLAKASLLSPISDSILARLSLIGYSYLAIDSQLAIAIQLSLIVYSYLAIDSQLAKASLLSPISDSQLAGYR